MLTLLTRESVTAEKLKNTEQYSPCSSLFAAFCTNRVNVLFLTFK